MGAGMDIIVPGLYLGSKNDSEDREQIEKYQITHILSIHDDAKTGPFKNINYLCIQASDYEYQDLSCFFSTAIDFIHDARKEGGNVLVHCMAGVSRSTSIVIAYIMVVTDLSWFDAMNAVRGARKITNPNLGFQKQLVNFGQKNVIKIKQNLINKYGEFSDDDKQTVNKLLRIFDQHHDIQINEQKTKALSPNEYYVNYEICQDSSLKNKKSFDGSFSIFNKKNKKKNENSTLKTYQYCTITGAFCLFLFILKLLVLTKF